MDHETIEEHLEEHGVRPTAVRINVWREVMNYSETFSLNDIEQKMPEMDRSSIFRALRLFTEHYLLHEINDGTGHQKYCVCRCGDGRHINHVHFTCIVCNHTYCLEDYKIPVVPLPDGFTMNEVEYVIKGVCCKCRKKQ